MSQFNILLVNYLCQNVASKEFQFGFLVFAISLPLLIKGLQKVYQYINKNKIEIALYLYKKYKVFSEFFSRKSEQLINFFHYVEEQQIFHLAGYSKGKPIKIEPHQVIVDREISVKINGKDVPSLSGFEFNKVSKYDSSTTFVFIYPHIVAHEDDFELEVKCLITDNSASRKYEKGSTIDLKFEINSIIEKDLDF